MYNNYGFISYLMHKKNSIELDSVHLSSTANNSALSSSGRGSEFRFLEYNDEKAKTNCFQLLFFHFASSPIDFFFLFPTTDVSFLLPSFRPTGARGENRFSSLFSSFHIFALSC